MISLFLASVYETFLDASKEKKEHPKIIVEAPSPKRKANIPSNEEAQRFFNLIGQMNKRDRSPKHFQMLSEMDEKESEKQQNGNEVKEKFQKKSAEHKKAISVFLGKIRRILENNVFIQLIYFFIVADIIVLCMNDSSVNKKEEIVLQKIDFAFFIVFFIEINLRFPVSNFRSDFILFVEIIVIYGNLVIYIFEDANPTYHIFEKPSEIGKGFRVLKALRIFRMLYFTTCFTSLSIITKALFNTMRKMIKYFFILAVLVVVFALMGMVLFSNRARVEETERLGLHASP